MKIRRFSLYLDGAARGNPGPAGIGVVIKDENSKTVKEFFKYIGETTNNVAEYNALVYGLQEALALKADEVSIHIDSELVAQQLNGRYRVRDEKIRPLFDQAIHMLSGFKNFEVKHIDRRDNSDADRLANKAINLSGLKR